MSRMRGRLSGGRLQRRCLRCWPPCSRLCDPSRAFATGRYGKARQGIRVFGRSKSSFRLAGTQPQDCLGPHPQLLHQCQSLADSEAVCCFHSVFIGFKTTSVPRNLIITGVLYACHMLCAVRGIFPERTTDLTSILLFDKGHGPQ